tara:strand:+ start:124 stop:711 length:588 start_codon:yes stop_codon:yes gene_type:complete
MKLLTWNNAIIKAHEQLIAEQNTQIIGKIRQAANEHVVQEWLSTEFKVYRHEEIPDKMDLFDHNKSGWDMVELESGMRIQAKYRAGKNEANRWHMEQTRRTSGANKNKSHNGQVRYGEDEFDIIIFTSPEAMTDQFSTKDLIAIPASELKDPKKKGFMFGRVPVKLIKKWRSKDPMSVVKNLRTQMLDKKKRRTI